jgi:hypothetical protein
MVIKNWQEFQHFKNRNPPWIKVYKKLLDDPEWFALSGADAKILVMLWLIASQDESKSGQLPSVNKLAFRLRLSEEKLTQTLQRLTHWVSHDDIKAISERYQPVSEIASEIRDQIIQRSDNSEADSTEGEPTQAQARGSVDSFMLTPELEAWSAKEGIPNPGQYVEEFKDYWRSAGEKRKNGQTVKDWAAAFRNRLRVLKEQGKLKAKTDWKTQFLAGEA